MIGAIYFVAKAALTLLAFEALVAAKAAFMLEVIGAIYEVTRNFPSRDHSRKNRFDAF
ncbi:MAG: hypothetical protein LBO72_08235 [Helicobacteraceae bacterium]|nr:hypothetical protein [Helicobacteraceae bacterium]